MCKSISLPFKPFRKSTKPQSEREGGAAEWKPNVRTKLCLQRVKIKGMFEEIRIIFSPPVRKPDMFFFFSFFSTTKWNWESSIPSSLSAGKAVKHIRAHSWDETTSSTLQGLQLCPSINPFRLNVKCICLALFTTLCGRGRHRDDLRTLRSAEQSNHKNSEREWEVELGDMLH